MTYEQQRRWTGIPNAFSFSSILAINNSKIPQGVTLDLVIAWEQKRMPDKLSKSFSSVPRDQLMAGREPSTYSPQERPVEWYISGVAKWIGMNKNSLWPSQVRRFQEQKQKQKNNTLGDRQRAWAFYFLILQLKWLDTSKDNLGCQLGLW